MCAISGIIGPNWSDQVTPARLAAMSRILKHRGPDDSGFYLTPAAVHGPRAGLGHQRLSIIDLTSGHQPMSNEDGNIWIVYNGEIYNHQEVRKELEVRGHRYRSRSDTETIIHAYEEFGADCVRQLRGMFAFALWDGRRKRLFAARDRLGIKPFYYALHDGHFLFASEIKSILASGLVPAVMNTRVLPEFFTFGQVVDDSTLFQGIHKLMPGHRLCYDGERLTVERYWDWQFDEPATYEPDEFYLERFVELLEESVRLHLLSDVPLGVLLSGGVDSSLLAAIAARQASGPVQTFTVGFEEKSYNELRYAREVSQHLGSEHHEVLVQPGEFFDALPTLIWHRDEPLKFTSSVALYFVSELARRHVKVVLCGEGSDELFAGYNDRYWISSWNLRLAKLGDGWLPADAGPRLVRENLWKLPLPLKLKKGISHTLFYHGSTVEGFLFDNFYSFFTREMQGELLSPALSQEVGEINPYANAVALLRDSNARTFLHQMLYADVKMYLLEILMKQDQMSMAASVESRVPFLDHVLTEFAGTVPPHLRLRGRSGKRLVKLAAERYLPRHIVHRPKVGFPVPFDIWLKENKAGVVREVLFDERTRQRGYFNMDYVGKLFDAHEKDQRDCHSQLWMLLNFELWHRTFLDGAPTARAIALCCSTALASLLAG
ncbi:MAG TPA: asparagine synthase (glutamine-hydrolyzing) [Candidatus Binatia bacterium]|jgi:asparagine synthase (glutamine-hydrolysing)